MAGDNGNLGEEVRALREELTHLRQHKMVMMYQSPMKVLFFRFCTGMAVGLDRGLRAFVDHHLGAVDHRVHSDHRGMVGHARRRDPDTDGSSGAISRETGTTSLWFGKSWACATAGCTCLNLSEFS